MRDLRTHRQAARPPAPPGPGTGGEAHTSTPSHRSGCAALNWHSRCNRHANRSQPTQRRPRLTVAVCCQGLKGARIRESPTGGPRAPRLRSTPVSTDDRPVSDSRPQRRASGPQPLVGRRCAPTARCSGNHAIRPALGWKQYERRPHHRRRCCRRRCHHRRRPRVGPRHDKLAVRMDERRRRVDGVKVTVGELTAGCESDLGCDPMRRGSYGKAQDTEGSSRVLGTRAVLTRPERRDLLPVALR